MRHGATTFAGTLMLLLCFTQAVSACPDDDLRTDQSQRPAQQPKVKEGGKDDIDAIGNRDIGGRGLGNWYSLETEIRMGRGYAQMIDSTVKLVQDPVTTEYVIDQHSNVEKISVGSTLSENLPIGLKLCTFLCVTRSLGMSMHASTTFNTRSRELMS